MNIDRLRAEGHVEGAGEDFKTYGDLSSIGIALTADGRSAGLLIEPMDEAPFVIDIGPVEELKALAKYIMEVADHLEEDD